MGATAFIIVGSRPYLTYGLPNPGYVLVLYVLVLDAKYRELKDNVPSSDMLRQLYVYSRRWEYESGHTQEDDSKPPAVIIVPSSSTYNPGLSDNPLDFEFFDGRKLFVVAYNMEYLKNGNVSKADNKFKEVLNQLVITSMRD